MRQRTMAAFLRMLVPMTAGTLCIQALFFGSAPLRAEASGPQPTFLRTLAGPSEAPMYPSGLTWDPSYQLNGQSHPVIVVADTGYNRISIFDPSSATPNTPLLMFGSLGTADGQFNTPRQVAVDANSNIYVADAANNRIQAFAQDGTHLWTAPPAGSGTTCASCLNTPIGMSYDSVHNEVLVADTGGSLVKAYNPATGDWLWSSPTLGVQSPRDVVLGPDGRIWVTDYHHQQVKAFAVTWSTGTEPTPTWTTTPAIVLGDGLAGGHGNGQLNSPYDVRFSPDGTIAYVADTGNERIAEWNVGGSSPVWIGTVGSRCASPCPPPPQNAANFVALRRVIVDPAGNLWAADFWGSGIHEFTAAGSTSGQLEIDGNPAPAPGFAEAWGVTVGPDGTTYGVDRLNQRIEEFGASSQTSGGSFLNVEGQRGVAAGQYSWPETAAVAPDHTLWVGDTRNDRLQHFVNADLSGTPATVGTTGSSVGQFNYLEGISVDSAGTVWIADSRNNRIQSYDPVHGTFTAYGSFGSSGAHFSNPEGVAVSSTAIYVADTYNNRIVELDRSGNFVAAAAGLDGPQGLALAPDGTLWVADTGTSTTDTSGNRILHLSAGLADLGNDFGVPDSSSTPGPTEFSLPHSVAVSPDGSILFVADTQNSRIQEYSLGAAGPADHLVFVSQPGGGNTGQPFSDQPEVSVVDASGDVVVTDSSSVTLGITPGSGTAGASLGCTTNPLAASSGIAAFSGCAVDRAGSGYTITATDGSLTAAVSQPFSVVTTFGVNPVYKGQLFSPNGAASIYPDGGIQDPNNANLIYITDAGNSRVMVLDQSTSNLSVLIPTTFSIGGGKTSSFGNPRGMQLDPDGQHIWVPDTQNNRLVEFDLTGNYVRSLPSTSTSSKGNVLTSPYGVVFDGSNAYVANTYGYSVVALNLTTGATVWKATSCGGKNFTRIRGIGWGPDGHLYATDTDNNRIVELDTTGACLGSFGTGGAAPGQFKSPRDVIADPSGNGLWVSDAGNYRIQHLQLNGTPIAVTSAGQGSGPGQFISAQTLFIDSGMVAVSDTYNFDVELFSIDSTGAPVFDTRIAQGTPPAPGGFDGAWSVTYDSSGDLYATDWFNHRVEKFDANGNFVLSFGFYGDQAGDLEFPRGVAVSADGSTVAVANENNNLSEFSSSGVFLRRFAPSGGLHRPRQVSFDPRDGTLWIADFGHNRVLHIDGTGKVLMALTDGGHIKAPQGVIVNSSGNIFVSNSGQNSVEEYSSAGALVATLAPRGTGPGQVMNPSELALAGPAGQQVLLIADTGNNRVVSLSLGGSRPPLSFGSAGSGNGQFNVPDSVAYDPLHGDVAVADFANNRVSVWGETAGYAVNPTPIAATATLAPGSVVTVAVDARTSAGAGAGSAMVYVSFIPCAGGGSAAIGGTPLTSSPQPFQADANGIVDVVYSTPGGSVPTTGQDVLTVQNAAAIPTVSASDDYAYG